MRSTPDTCCQRLDEPGDAPPPAGGNVGRPKKSPPPHADLFSLRSGTARERWPVTSRIRVELPVDHVDEPERSRQPSSRSRASRSTLDRSVWVPRRKNKCPDRSPMTELVGASASPSRARRIHHPELRKTTSCANQEQ